MTLKNWKEDFKDNTKKLQCSGRCHVNSPDIIEQMYPTIQNVHCLHFDEALLASPKLLRWNHEMLSAQLSSKLKKDILNIYGFA